MQVGHAGFGHQVESPALPDLSVPTMSYGEKISGLDLGESSTLSYTITGLPPGLTNESAFSPDEVPGLFAWYDADSMEALWNTT